MQSVQLTSKIDILLVDDHKENLLTLEAVLKSSHYNLIKANSGEEALRYLLNNEPALILLDVQMPKMDGFATAQLIKTNERTRSIPIIFVTALNKGDHFVQLGYEYGAVDYIYKPYDPYILKSKVAVFADLANKSKRLIHAEKELAAIERSARQRQFDQLELRSLRREKAAQQKYRTLVDGIQHAVVWSADPSNLKITFVSPSTNNILGICENVWLNQEDFLQDHIYPDDAATFFEALQRAVIKDEDINIEHRFINSKGKLIWLKTELRKSIYEEENRVEINGLSVDISKLKDTEAALQKSMERSDFLASASLLLSESLDYETTFDRVGSLIVPRLADQFEIDIINSNGETESLSKARKNEQDSELNTLNLQLPLSLYSNLPLFFPNLTPDLLSNIGAGKEQLESLANSGIHSLMIIPLIARKRTLGAMTLAFVSSQQKYDRFDLTTAMDLGQRIALAIDNAFLYRQAQTAIRARDEFLSIASHELKTPLTPLKLQTQSLMRVLVSSDLSAVSPDKLNKMLQTSNRQLSKLSNLIDTLLDISRISAGKLELYPEKFDLAELVRDVVERHQDQLNASKCDIAIQAPDCIPVHLDRIRIDQILNNLLTNAIKYGPGKPIKITLDASDETVLIHVEDHGIGIKQEDQKRIFGRFERAVSGNYFAGLGLGLFIVNQIIEAHHGKVSVRSEYGSGSTFTVSLPRVLTQENDKRGSAA